uniref:Fcf2 domain-containing protein n=1 Tax=Ascaris lumbricoides TaxID=6252 RepID=A0A0M3HXD1_ASCLU
MRGSLFPIDSSSESEESIDSDDEQKREKRNAIKSIRFRCAPKHASSNQSKRSCVSELFVVDRNEKQNDGDAADENVAVNVEETRKKRRKKSKEENSYSTTTISHPCKSSAVASFIGISEDKAIKELLAKSIIQPGFEKILGEGHKPMSRRALARQRKVVPAERERTKGQDWFDLPATEMTEERVRDLQIIQMRDALDTKTHYKRNDRSVLPKYFQVGTIVENKADFYSSRIPKKQRKRTIVEELMADEEFQTKQKKKYDEIKAMEAIKKRGTFQHSTYRRRSKKKLKL